MPWWLRRPLTTVVALVGIVSTIGTAGYIAHRPGTYWSEVHVVFLAPLSQQNPNSLQAGSTSVVMFAGVVARVVGSSTPITTVSDSVSLVSTGVKHGYEVRLPNDGGQWANDFDQQLLDVQATGSTQQEVSNTMTTVLAKINATVTDLQTGVDVSKADLIYTSQSPPSIPLFYTKGNNVRIIASIGALGIAFTVAAVGLIKRSRRAWQRSNN
jgi:hypothetical protein